MKQPSSGFAVGPILMMVALLAIIGAATVKISSKNFRGDRMYGSQADIVSQARYIGNRVRQCVLIYDTGNNGTGFNVRYPAATAVTAVNNLTCPGQPAPNNLWTGQGGSFAPRLVPGFLAWNYQNDVNGVKITIQSDGSVDGNSILSTTAARFNATEASYSSGVLTVWLVKP